jgi:uncharacterized protein (DUF1501 family)
MTMITRRSLLHSAAAAGLYSLMPQLTLAATAGNKRLVVIIQRGGMDALDAIQPWGDPDFAKLRPAAAGLAPADAFDVDGFYAFHESLRPLEPLFKAHELTALHAVSTPYRERSHFDAQDFLERGEAAGAKADSGWVNRLIALVGGRRMEFAADIGPGASLIMEGTAPRLNIYPDTDLGFWSDSTQFLEMLYKDDPAFQPVLESVRLASADAKSAQSIDPGVSTREVSALAARLLRADCRIASFSIYGWDTHVNQGPRLGKSLAALAEAITTLKAGLGDAWADTLVIAASEFGRTARFNGSKGTDHGTGGAAFFAGGLLANGLGGKVIADRWPGLGDGKLLDGRDLQPVDDVRRAMAWAVSGMYGLSPDVVATQIFPGVEAGSRLKLI